VRIVFLNPSGELGGAETALLEMLAALREARPAWTLGVVASAPGPLLDRAAELGAEVAALTFPRQLASLGEWGQRGSLAARARLAAAACGAALPTIGYASRLHRHLVTWRPDIVHTNGLKMHLLGSRCRPGGVPVLWHMHDYPDSRPLTAVLLHAQAHRCAQVVANSESVARAAHELLGPQSRVRVVYNAVDLDRFQPEGASIDLDALAGLPPLEAGGLRVGLVATFARWKGHDVFLKALSALRAPVPVRGYVIGGPIYETASSQFSSEELRHLATSCGLRGGSIGFTGRVADVPAAMRSLDVVVHASTDPEPFGLVIAEAMACGRPIVVSRAGGAEEIAQAGALFHAPGNAAELAGRLTELASNPAMRAALAKAGRDAAVRLFGRARLASSLIPLYESLAPGAINN
jgi:glycosyltransferase involved in cell wall biosynthesis